ncbi:MAG: uracil-DNA glycosylase family protein [Candidatus Binatia bacterium]
MQSAQASLRMLLAQVRAYVEYQQSTGVECLPRAVAAAARAASKGSASSWRMASPAPSPPLASRPAAPLRVAAVSGDLFTAPGLRRAATLDELRRELGDCQRCKLSRGRTHIVFGVGNPRAALMFVGEGPGRDEDLKAEPFVGRAGQLLTEIITKGMKLRRADVYIANVIKCRPPGNRNPEPEEIAACQPFLLRQIEIVRPRVVVALGTFAAQTLLGLRTPISRLRGHWYDWQGVKLMPTLHPAYLLRNPSDKKLVWEDVKLVLRELERSA